MPPPRRLGQNGSNYVIVRKVDPISASNIDPPMSTISTWIGRRWPGLQRANQVRVMGLFGFSLENGF